MGVLGGEMPRGASRPGGLRGLLSEIGGLGRVLGVVEGLSIRRKQAQIGARYGLLGLEGFRRWFG